LSNTKNGLVFCSKINPVTQRDAVKRTPNLHLAANKRFTVIKRSFGAVIINQNITGATIRFQHAVRLLINVS
jgi:hypothetical protein